MPRYLGFSAKASLGTRVTRLNLFGEVFERRPLRREKPDDGKLSRSAINGMLAGLICIERHSAHSRAATCRCRRAGEFGGLDGGHDGGWPRRGSGADRRYAGGQGRRHGQRHHHPSRRRGGARPDVNQAVEKMRGPVNDKIKKLENHAQGRDKPIEVTIVRDFIEVTPAATRITRARTSGCIRIIRINEADRRQPQEGDQAHQTPINSAPTRSRASSLICATIRVGPARRGDFGAGRLPGEGRDLDPRAAMPRRPALQRDPANPTKASGLSRRSTRLGVGVGNRRRALQDASAPRSWSARASGKGSAADHHPAGPGNGALRDDGLVLHSYSAGSIQAKVSEPDIKASSKTAAYESARRCSR